MSFLPLLTVFFRGLFTTSASSSEIRDFRPSEMSLPSDRRPTIFGLSTELSRRVTVWSPTTAPVRLPSSDLREYFPFASVTPDERMPPDTTGLNSTWMFSSGFPFKVTTPSTSAIGGPLAQPAARASAARQPNEAERKGRMGWALVVGWGRKQILPSATQVRVADGQ